MTINLESAFRDLFSTPEKWMTILLLAVCMSIPIVGPIVIFIPLYIVGYLALLIGIYPVAAALDFVAYHIMFQRYDLYVERGGEEVAVADYVYGSVPLPPPPVPPSLRTGGHWPGPAVGEISRSSGRLPTFACTGH